MVKFWTVIDLADPRSSHVAEGITRHDTYRQAVAAAEREGFARPNVAGWVSSEQFDARRAYVQALPELSAGALALIGRPA